MLSNGRRFRVLRIVDALIREGLAARVALRFKDDGVVGVLEGLAAERDAPPSIREDKGPECRSAQLKRCDIPRKMVGLSCQSHGHRQPDICEICRDMARDMSVSRCNPGGRELPPGSAACAAFHLSSPRLNEPEDYAEVADSLIGQRRGQTGQEMPVAARVRARPGVSVLLCLARPPFRRPARPALAEDGPILPTSTAAPTTFQRASPGRP